MRPQLIYVAPANTMTQEERDTLAARLIAEIDTIEVLPSLDKDEFLFLQDIKDGKAITVGRLAMLRDVHNKVLGVKP